MKVYVTFGQAHVHSINGKTFDKDCVAVINSSAEDDPRLVAHFYFGLKYGRAVSEDKFYQITMAYFPRGLIEVNPEE